MRKWELYQEALILWGEGAQIAMAVEEMAELIQALTRLGRNRDDATEDKVREEIADVEIMMEQLRISFGVRAIESIKVRKLHRLERRIKKNE